MTLANYVPARGRVYIRRFDHEEALARWRNGERATDLAAEYGVSVSAIYRLPRKAQEVENHRRWRSGICEDCGGPAMRLVAAKLAHNPDGLVLCNTCRGKLRRKRLVDVDGTLQLQCGSCGEMKPLREHLPRTRRRLIDGRAVNKSTCRACEARKRQDYRERHKVPCEICGAPCLPPREKGHRQADRAMCRACYSRIELPEHHRRAVEASARARRKGRGVTSSGSDSRSAAPSATSRVDDAAAHATPDPDNRGRQPQTDEGETRTRSVSTQGSCRPETSYYAFLDCLIAFADIGRIDVAEKLAERWADVLV